MKVKAKLKLKRSIARGLAVAALATASAAALAGEWAFDDRYWQKPGATSYVAPKDAAAAQTDNVWEKYRLVDRYNP